MADKEQTLKRQLSPNLCTPKSKHTVKLRETEPRLAEKEELLRKLKMVRTYRTKWEMNQLETVTSDWLRVCQAALVDLRTHLSQGQKQDSNTKPVSLLTVTQCLGIDPDLIGLNVVEDCFDNVSNVH